MELLEPPNSDIAGKIQDIKSRLIQASDKDVVDDISLSPEQQARKERIERREKIITPTVMSQFPDRDMNGTSIDQFDDEDIGYGSRLLREYKQERSRVILAIAMSEIPDQDMCEYAGIIFELQKVMTPDGDEVHPNKAAHLIRSAESIEKARQYVNLAKVWERRFLKEAPSDQRKRRVQMFGSVIGDISGVNISPRKIRSLQETGRLFDGFADLYQYELTLPTDIYAYSRMVKKAGLDFGDPDQMRKAIKIHKLTVESGVDQETADIFLDVVSRYFIRHKLTDRNVEGLITRLLPAIQRRDVAVELLLKPGNRWAMREDEFGAADFICHCYALEVAPLRINELTYALREVPTTNVARLEQNRKDSININGSLREITHDQRPYLHDVINNLVAFYDTGDIKVINDAINRAVVYESSFVPPAYLSILNGVYESFSSRDYFDEEVDTEVDGQKMREKRIDVLRRMIKNTAPIDEDPPETGNVQLNISLKRLQQNPKNTDVLQEVLVHTNADLIRRMKGAEIGIEPSQILALIWTGQKAVGILQNMSYEYQTGAYETAWFHELLKFQELIASPHDFNQPEFDKFIDQIDRAGSFQTAYKLIAKRRLEQIDLLARIYRKRGKPHWADATWSGNVDEELIGLIDFKKPETVIGKKLLIEMAKGSENRLQGD